jgi:hypothetical protein
MKKSECKPFTAVKVLDSDPRPGIRGLVGFINTDTQVKVGMVCVSFDYELTNQCPHGVRPQNLEFYGDYEDFARWSLAQAILNKQVNAQTLLAVAHEVWNKQNGMWYLFSKPEDNSITLIEQVREKYGYAFNPPW